MFLNKLDGQQKTQATSYFGLGFSLPNLCSLISLFVSLLFSALPLSKIAIDFLWICLSKFGCDIIILRLTHNQNQVNQKRADVFGSFCYNYFWR